MMVILFMLCILALIFCGYLIFLVATDYIECSVQNKFVNVFMYIWLIIMELTIAYSVFLCCKSIFYLLTK